MLAEVLPEGETVTAGYDFDGERSGDWETGRVTEERVSERENDGETSERVKRRRREEKKKKNKRERKRVCAGWKKKKWGGREENDGISKWILIFLKNYHSYRVD